MEEGDKMKTTLEKIEKLIVDGQKEVLGKIGQVESSLRQVESSLRQEIQETKEGLNEKIDLVHSSLKNEIATTAKVLDYDIKEVGRKLDAHVRQPAYGG